MSLERRQHPRQPVRLLVQHQSQPDAPFEVDYAADLSQGGLFLRTGSGLELDATVHVQFAPARDARVIEAFCRIARITNEGVGAEFLHLDESATALIAEVLGEAPLALAAMAAPGRMQLQA